MKHVGQRTVGLRLRHCAKRGDLDHARGDAQLIAGALKAADDREIETARACGVGVRARLAAREQRPIDHAQCPNRAEIVGHGLGDAGREPRDVRIAGHVGKVQDGDRSCPGHGRRARAGAPPVAAGTGASASTTPRTG
jgi:hypothetical protein